MSALALRALARLLALVPLGWLHALAVPLGRSLGWLPWSKNAVVSKNLALCFPDKTAAERKRLHRDHLVELARLGLELGALAHWSPERLDRHVDTEGWAAIERARASGRGILLVSGHLGNWELLNLYLSRHLSMATLYRPAESPGINAFMTRSRERFGGRMVASGSPAMRQLLAQLRAGRTAGIAADIQPKKGEGVFVDFFDTPALTMTLVNRLARRTGCEVILTWAERKRAGKGWVFHFTRAGEAIAGEDPTRALASMHRWLEDAIRQAPAQYLWIYKRFSRRPEGQPPIYEKSRRSG